MNTNELDKVRAAQHRSMPLTRMLDYGMDHWDASYLTAGAPSHLWHEMAEQLAETQLSRAKTAIDAGNLETAVACYRRATAALIFAQLEFNSDTETKKALYIKMSGAYSAAAELDNQLSVQKLSIPFRSSSCTAWLVRTHNAQPRPPVVIIGGQSGWGPAYHLQAEALVRRGLTAVLLEAPGQGESRMLGGLHLDGDVHEAFSATADSVCARTNYDGPLGVWGNSLGGLLAANAAIHDSRFRACCVNGATLNPSPSPYRTALEQAKALFGVNSSEALGRASRSLWLDPARDQMLAALLVLHGGADPLVSLDQQRKYLELSDDATLRVWDDGEHTIYNHSAERTDYVADWFRAYLGSGSPKFGRRLELGG